MNEKLDENTKKLDSKFNELKNLIKENIESSTEYDSDDDAIMKTSSPVKQVPEPGFFYGDVKETELFCELCFDTFKTEPNNLLPESAKINFVQSRLRDAARIWYKIKYKDGSAPATMLQLLTDLSQAFPNVTSTKLAKLQLLDLKQHYGKITTYIEEFRNLSRSLELDDSSLTLLFLNGLHSRYKQEIIKSDILPDTLEEIITKCILFENSLNTNNKINNNNKHNNKRKSNNNNKMNKNFKNYNQNNYRNYNNNNNNNNKINNNFINKVQKISSKN